MSLLRRSMPRKICFRWNGLAAWAVWEVSPEEDSDVTAAGLASDFASWDGGESWASATPVTKGRATDSAANNQRVLIRLSSVETGGNEPTTACANPGKMA